MTVVPAVSQGARGGGASPCARCGALFASFAEANLKVTDVDYQTCGTCGGRGALTVYDTSGSSSKICNRCSGPGADRIVSFY